MTSEEDKKALALERKRKRLEAWRKRQEQQENQETTHDEESNPNNGTGNGTNPSSQLSSSSSSLLKKPKISISINASKKKKSSLKKKKKKKKENESLLNATTATTTAAADFMEEEEGEKQSNTLEMFDLNHSIDDNMDINMDMDESSKKGILNLGQDETENTKSNGSSGSGTRKRRRWDVSSNNDKKDNPTVATGIGTGIVESSFTTDHQMKEEDDLDKFMNQLEAGAMGAVAAQDSILDINMSTNANMNTNANTNTHNIQPPVSGSVITPDVLAQLTNSSTKENEGAGTSTSGNGNDNEAQVANKNQHQEHNEKHNNDTDDDDDEEEEEARRSFIAALRNTKVTTTTIEQQQQTTTPVVAQLASEVQSEKQRRETHMSNLKKEAAAAHRASTAASQPNIGRIYYADVESGIMEEAERNLNVMNAASGVDALEILSELNKKKELKAVDHSIIEYINIRKNLYIVPRSLANLSDDEVVERRVKHKIRVRGRGAPTPIDIFEECGLSERILNVLKKMKIERPFAVQAQCLPCIMAGRDVIGIAKTGSGKTLAYLLPMLRHIGDQPDVASHESGPIGLVLAPARELAVQIHSVTKSFAKHLGMKIKSFCMILLFNPFVFKKKNNQLLTNSFLFVRFVRFVVQFQ